MFLPYLNNIFLSAFCMNKYKSVTIIQGIITILQVYMCHYIQLKDTAFQNYDGLELTRQIQITR